MKAKLKNGQRKGKEIEDMDIHTLLFCNCLVMVGLFAYGSIISVWVGVILDISYIVFTISTYGSLLYKKCKDAINYGGIEEEIVVEEKEKKDSRNNRRYVIAVLFQ
jgi:uncharacterized membrane protein